MYLSILGSQYFRKTVLRTYLLTLLLGVTIWFLLLQLVWLRQVCPWCMTAHLIALTIVVLEYQSVLPLKARSVIIGFMGATIFAMVQVFGPVPSGYRIDKTKLVNVSTPAGIHASGSGRKVPLAGGMKLFNVEVLPHLGPSDATHILVEYFDYQCPACRTLSGYVDALLAKHPREIAVIILPVPLDRACNTHLDAALVAHPGSCDISCVALAVWRANPSCSTIPRGRSSPWT